MPLKRLKKIAAAACLIASQFVPAFSAIPHVIKAQDDLTHLSAELQVTVDKDVHVISFQSYANVGKLKLDNPSDKIDSLILMRADTTSDAVIKVDSTFLELKSMPGPVIIRGLAFQLMNPKAVLIAGAETNKENRKLIIEDCFIFADSLEATSLSWLGDVGSSVEIRRTFFVSRAGKPTTRINLSAGDITLSNNLFNFPGAVFATVKKSIEISSNNINRTQFKLTGEILGVQPKIRFFGNFISHAPTTDATGVAALWAVVHSGFDLRTADVKDNRLYHSWAGFDYYQPGMTDTLWHGSQRNTPFDDNRFGKPATELWDWYTTGVDSITGMQTGDYKRATRYNVLPGDKPSFSWTLPKAALTAYFQPAPYPREIRIDTSEVFPAVTQPPVRPLFPRTKALKFGAFRVDSISYSGTSIYGKPVLVIKDSLSQPALQPILGNINDSPSVFVNTRPAARAFMLANYGNTARGADITPVGPDSKLTVNDRLVFSQVDSAGFTYIVEPQPGQLDDDIRSLATNIGIRTTAATSGTVTFGTFTRVAPYLPAKVLWYLPASKTYIPVSGSDSGRYLLSTPYSSISGVEFKAILVERLSVKRGDVTTDVAGGTLRTLSLSGFQLMVNDSAAVDTAQYGRASKGFRFSWLGRAGGDSVILSLKAGQDQQAFVTTAQGTSKLPIVPDGAGNFRIPIGPDDSLKTFFLAMKNNVKAGVTARGNLEDAEGVFVEGFNSSTSGRLTFEVPPANFLESATALKDTSLSNARILGGRILTKKNLNSTTPFGISFGVAPYKNADKVEAYSFDGQSWTKLPDPKTTATVFNGDNLPILPARTEIVLIVERLAAPENYVTLSPVVAGNKVTVAPVFLDALRPVTGYCLELQSVNSGGIVETETCAERPITDTISLVLQPNTVYLYRIRYFMGNDKITRAFQLLSGTSWDIKLSLPDSLNIRAKKRWHLLGFPVEGAFYGVMQKGGDGPDPKKFLDTTLVVKMQWSHGAAKFDTLKEKEIENLKVKPGDAYLFASARTFATSLAAVTGVLTAKPFKMHLDSGWNFISNPFPTRLLKARIRSVVPKILTFYQMTYDTTSSVKGVKKYGWNPDSPVLRAFEGYAYYTKKEDTLVFDPLADTAAQGSGKVAAGTASPGLQASLETPWGDSRMALSADARQPSIPFLPTPGGAAELRLGGQAGYMIKTVGSLAAIDEQVEIRSAEAGRGSFRLAFAEGAVPGPATPQRVRLIDLTSGTIYDEAAAADLPIAEGSRTYRLLAGDQAFVEGRTQAVLAGAPKEIGLSQNFPNPFRGRTRVALDWPAWQTGERRAVLEVMDVRGRSIVRMNLADIRVGRQVVTLDASGWRPGIYLYRLTVFTGERQARLQKRMMVSP